jgi:nitrate/nitrite transporter NarK
VRPLDAVALRELAEYLWLFTVYNNAGHAVIASDALAPDLTHALTLASLERAVGGTICDRVTVHHWSHAADAATGIVVLATAVVREFSVRQEAGALMGC